LAAEIIVISDIKTTSWDLRLPWLQKLVLFPSKLR